MGMLTEIIRAEITARGVIPFAEFMELALYCPEYGYYEKKSGTVGRGGDFYTSVSVGPLFGTLLAWQFARWLERLPGGPVYLVEAGAHDGKLAGDILDWLAAQRPELLAHLRFVIVEPSSARRNWQMASLRRHGDRLAWVADLSELPADGAGVIFSNELLDAFPVRRIGWCKPTQQWFEWGVVWEAGAFRWAKLSRTPELPEWFQVPPALQMVLPANYTVELNGAAELWWSRAARSLRRGWLLTIDYGLDEEDFWSPHRPQGTLRAYQGHREHAEVLSHPGEQDLTAHVNFSRLQRAGVAAGLRTEFYGFQEQFLLNILRESAGGRFSASGWDARQKREWQTLIHPEHLGRRFRVLLQSRGMTGAEVEGRHLSK